MTLINKEQLLSDIVNLPSPLGISSNGVDATYMEGYLTGKAQRQFEIIDIINKQQKFKNLATDTNVPTKKRKRKFRAMTINEHCSKGCSTCEYSYRIYCNYLSVTGIYRHKEGDTPYKTRAGKYILIEVKED